MIAVSTFSIGFFIHENVILYNTIYKNNLLKIMSFIDLDKIGLIKLTCKLNMSAINIKATRTK